MKYDFLMKDIEAISKGISLNKKILISLSGDEVTLFKQSLHKNLTLEIYTFWENFAKNLIYECYLNYKKILVDKKFMISFFKNIQEKSYARQLFLKGIDDNKFNITMDNLCFSNNLTYNELKSLLKRVMFDVSEFEKHVNGFPKLDEAIENLKEKEVYPIFENVKSIYKSIEYLEAYLDLLVGNRNSVAHQYQLTEIYNINQFEAILNFIGVVTLLIFEFCGSQLLKKGKSKNEVVYNRLFPVRVIRGNNKDTNAIVWIRNISRKIINKDLKLYCFDENNNIYRIVDIVKICNKEKKECIEILPLEDYTIELITSCKIKSNNKNFVICELDQNCDSYDYNIIV